MTEIVNRVASSSIISLNLEDFYPQEERVVFDLKDFLFQELILKEKDFRQALKNLDWSVYKEKWVAISCSADAIIPTWAYMLVCTYLEGVSKGYVIGSLENLEQHIAELSISGLEMDSFQDRPVVIKGCSKFPIPLFAYGRLVSLLQKASKSLMFGEPCSTVPLYKKAKS
ncbi:uncharacterized protein DUF2480 [Algoriphagus boseongensis]|uniref:Uncharacterized protein DUF2480 n=1 Tax=Algoriphagus boseongensis TaxID=1442587 RepID=A0A4R6T7V5_9BACT|nr:DUF2480 family protein [Algoriphagus boseongensis]TDQ17666.1 uncharacterized protein DUF2480 [Algoriphagus boseongensis]